MPYVYANVKVKFVAAVTRIAAVADREVLSLLDKTPYSP